MRIVPAMDVTGTLKQRKVALQREGYDLAVVADPLFLRDDAQGTYVPLTEALREHIRSGARPL